MPDPTGGGLDTPIPGLDQPIQKVLGNGGGKTFGQGIDGVGGLIGAGLNVFNGAQGDSSLGNIGGLASGNVNDIKSLSTYLQGLATKPQTDTRGNTFGPDGAQLGKVGSQLQGASDQESFWRNSYDQAIRRGGIQANKFNRDQANPAAVGALGRVTAMNPYTDSGVKGAMLRAKMQGLNQSSRNLTNATALAAARTGFSDSDSLRTIAQQNNEDFMRGMGDTESQGSQLAQQMRAGHDSEVGNKFATLGGYAGNASDLNNNAGFAPDQQYSQLLQAMLQAKGIGVNGTAAAGGLTNNAYRNAITGYAGAANGYQSSTTGDSIGQLAGLAGGVAKMFGF
jgi:hypothetical protein